MNESPKLILTKPSCTRNVMPYNYGYTFNIKTLVPLLQAEISGLTHNGHCLTLEDLIKAKVKEMIELDKEFKVRNL